MNTKQRFTPQADNFISFTILNMKITRRQQEYLDYIIDFQLKNRRCPVYEEFQEHFGVTKNAVVCVIDVMARKGLIVKERRMIKIHDSIKMTCE